MTKPTVTEDALLAHASAIRAIALELLGDADAAEDVLQETWIRTHRAQPDTERPLRAWMRHVARGIAQTFRRERVRRAQREAHYLAGSRGGDPGPDAALALREVTDAVLTLEEPYRSTVLQRYFEGRTPTEIAAQEGIPVATVSSRLTRAHAQLRAKLERRLGGSRGYVASLVMLARKPTRRAPWEVATAAGLAAAAAILIAFLWQVDGKSTPSESDAPAAPASFAAQPPSSAAAPAHTEATSRRAGAESRAETGAITSTGEAPYRFSLELIPTDRLGRAVAGVEIFGAPMGIVLHRLGSTPWHGRLLIELRGFEPQTELVLTARRGDIGDSDLLRVSLEAGKSKIVMPLYGARERSFGLRPPAADIETSMQMTLGDVPIVGHIFSQIGGPPPLLLDPYGNSCFRARGAIDGPEMEALDTAEIPSAHRRAEAPQTPSPAEEPPHAFCVLTIRSADGAPAAGAAVSLCGPFGGWRMDGLSNAGGQFHSPGFPSGTVDLWLGGGSHPLHYERLELGAGIHELERRLPSSRRSVLDLRSHAGPLSRWTIDGSIQGLLSRPESDAAGSVLIHDALRSAGPLLAIPPGQGAFDGRAIRLGAGSRNTVDIESEPPSAALTLLLPPLETAENRPSKVQLWNLDTRRGLDLLVPGADPGMPQDFTVQGIPAGTYRFEVQTGSGAVRRSSAVTVEPGGRHHVNLEPPPARARLAPLLTQGAPSGSVRWGWRGRAGGFRIVDEAIFETDPDRISVPAGAFEIHRSVGDQLLEGRGAADADEITEVTLR